MRLIHSMIHARHAIAPAVIAVMVTIGLPEPSYAQGLMEKVTKAARSFASVTTEAGMIGATALDLETRNLPTVSVGVLSVGISSIDFKDGVGIRVHLYSLNPTDQAVAIPMPTEGTFVLVDSKGRRLQFLSLKVKDAPKGSTTLIVPALERANINVLYNLPAGSAGEAILKVGTAGMIRGIPLGDSQPAAPMEASQTPAVPSAPPADTTVVPDSVSRIPKHRR